MAYTRQYTQGVGWENEPSINTPISAENLNQMDAAIQDVDEAAYNEFLAVYSAIAQAGGGNAVNFYIDNASNNTLASNSSVLPYGVTLKKDDIIFLYMSVDGDYTQAQTGWEVAYKMYVNDTLTTFSAVIRNYLYGEGAMWHEAFNLDLARGTWLILRVVDTTHFDCIGKIDPASGGGGSISYYSDITETVDDGNIYTDRNIFHGYTPSVGDMLFLRVDVDAHKTSGTAYPWYVVYGTAQSSVGDDQIYDCRSAFATIAFWQDIAAGSTLIMTYDGYVWDLRAVIPSASGGGTTVVANPSGTATDTLVKLQVGSTIYEIPSIDTAWAGKVTAVSGGNITPNNASFQSDPFTAGQFIILEIGVNAIMPSSVTSWSLQYTVDGNTVTRGIADKRNGNAYDPDFDDDLVSGSVIVLQYVGDNKFACFAVLNENGGGASTLAALTDTNITTPTDTQALKYDSASSKWVNVDALGNAYNFKIDSANNNTLIPVVMQRTLSKPFAKNDIIFLYMDTDGVFVPEEYVYRWMLQYTLNNTAVTGDIYDGLGNSSISLFNTNLPRGTWLVLLCETYNSEYHMQNYVCIGKIDPASGGGASTLAGLTDTNIVTPSDGQLLTYDATSGKWINASAGGGTGVLTYEIVTKSTSGTSAAVTVNKYVNKSRRSSTDYLYTQAQTPVTIDDKLVLDYGSTASGKWTYTLLEASENHAVGYSDSWAYSATVYKTEEYESQDNPETLDAIDDVSLTLPFGSGQPITYDATSGKWINGGIIPIANGGTGNATGYVQAGRKANTTIGGEATAEGIRTTASGNYSHAEGVDTLASNTGAHAEGGNTQATGLTSHAEGGGGVVASGASSHAEGASTQASGNYSHAEGQSTKAQATGAHAQNYNATASGNYSSAAGYYTTAGYQDQFVVGKYNNNKSTSIFEVGIGTGANARANGLELDTSGNLTVAGSVTDGDGNVLGGSLTASDVQDIKDAFVVPTTSAQMPILFDETGAEYVVGWYKLANGKKPVYQKTIVDTLPTVATEGTNSAKQISIGASVDIGFVVSAFFKSSSNNFNNIIFLNTGRDKLVSATVYPNDGVAYQNVISVNCNSKSYGGANAYFVLQYTKTTDTPV